MKENIHIEDKLRSLFPLNRFFINEPMWKHSTFRIGGNADFLVFPKDVDEIKSIYKIAQEENLEITILGNGSNILVRDKGIRGIVISVNTPFSKISQKGNVLIIQAGAILGAVAQYAMQHSLTGLEFAVGIPGTIGGAVFMNAGAYDGEMKNIVTCVKTLNKNGEIKTYVSEEMMFGYRNSIFQKNKEIILEIEITLSNGNYERIKEKMSNFTKKRIEKQPLEFPSAGSTFKRPEGNFAGTLIEKANLKGFMIGDAQVSEKHAGFIINKNKATAQDVIFLIKEVQKRVYNDFNILLQPEVKIIGEK